MRDSCPKERKAYPGCFLIIFFFSFGELIVSRGCCSDSLSRSRKAGDSSEKTEGLEGRGRRKEGYINYQATDL